MDYQAVIIDNISISDAPIFFPGDNYPRPLMAN
jgi:hypothetical protein